MVDTRDFSVKETLNLCIDLAGPTVSSLSAISAQGIFSRYIPAIAIARNEPNIIMTGTPGVGKTSHAELLAQSTGLKHLSINQVVKGRSCHEGWDDALQTWIVDEDKVHISP